jgi:opacity protein-like surface antigen
MRFFLKFFLIVFAAFFLCATHACAQDGPEAGGYDWQVWSGGGHAINGSQSSDSVANIGGRFGLILTNPVGPGFLRGRLEYAVDVVPVFIVSQKSGTAYGAGVNPFAFKWVLDTHKSVAPYFEIGGGTLFSNVKVPDGTSHVNFTTGGALGLHFLRSKYNLSTELRFMHISNASIARYNPGINTLQLRVGFGRFTRH